MQECLFLPFTDYDTSKFHSVYIRLSFCMPEALAVKYHKKMNDRYVTFAIMNANIMLKFKW